MIGTFDTQEENDRFNEYLKNRKPMRNKQSESHLQSECVRWFRYQYPDYKVLGNSREKVKRLGNAVTPPAMKWLVEQCVKSLM